MSVQCSLQQSQRHCENGAVIAASCRYDRRLSHLCRNRKFAVASDRWESVWREQKALVQHRLSHKQKGKAATLCWNVFWKYVLNSLRSFIDWQHHRKPREDWRLYGVQLHGENPISCTFFQLDSECFSSNCASLPCWLKLFEERTHRNYIKRLIKPLTR